MFSVPDIAVVAVLALLLFGPDKLPGMMRTAGRFMREVQNTSHTFIAEMERAADIADQRSGAQPWGAVRTVEPVQTADEPAGAGSDRASAATTHAAESAPPPPPGVSAEGT